MKKAHPCGENRWKIIRMGMDIRIKCEGCDHSVMIPRREFDSKVNKLTELVEPKKTVPTVFEFTDIAGIVKGASKGEGLGNKFLSHIRQVDAICQVVRCFEDENITHVSGKVDPIDDIETINLELIL